LIRPSVRGFPQIPAGPFCWSISVAAWTRDPSRRQAWDTAGICASAAAPRTFVASFPDDLKARIGRREIVRSLGALPLFERNSLSRRFGLACDEVFRIVRSQPSLTRGDIERLVAVYLDDLARLD
jgi:hypothetical protein